MVYARPGRGTSAPTTEMALTTMLREKRLARRSEETIDTYERNIRRFIAFYGADRSVEDITDDVVMEYATTILERKVTDETYAHYLRELKVFVRWLASRNYIPQAPRVILPTLHPKTRLNLVTPADFDKLVRALGGKTVWNLRDVALLSLLYDSGARISEITGLGAGDVNIEAGEAFVTGKGRKERTVFFGDETALRLHAYRRRIEQIAQPDWFFVSRSLGPLNRDSGAAILYRAKEKSGVTCDINPHNFRHSFATRFLRNGGNPSYLKRLLGHSTLKMTEYYVSLLTEDIKEAHQEFNDRKPTRRFVPARSAAYRK